MGFSGETWICSTAPRQAGEVDGFGIVDRDLGTHPLRSHRLGHGGTLSQAMRVLYERLGVGHAIVPMSDRLVTAIVHTRNGASAFQGYLVRRRCEPVVPVIELEGAENADPAPGFAPAVADRDLGAVVIRPSNPLLRIAPILSPPGVRAPAMAASPIVRGGAIEGSMAKIFRELGLGASAAGAARHCHEPVGCRVVDAAEAPAIPAIEAEGMRAPVTRTAMKDAGGRAALARQVLDVAVRAPVRAHD